MDKKEREKKLASMMGRFKEGREEIDKIFEIGKRIRELPERERISGAVVAMETILDLGSKDRGDKILIMGILDLNVKTKLMSELRKVRASVESLEGDLSILMDEKLKEDKEN